MKKNLAIKLLESFKNKDKYEIEAISLFGLVARDETK